MLQIWQKVKYKVLTNQLDDSLLAIGPSARTFLVEEEDSISPTSKAKFFTSVRNFYIVCVNKMLSKFPFKNTVLKDFVVLNPDSTKCDEYAASQVTSLAETFNIIPADKFSALEEEFLDYQLCDDYELPKYDP